MPRRLQDRPERQGTRLPYLVSIGPVALALLVAAGQLKAHPLLAWIPTDLTVLLTAVACLSFLASRVRLGPGSRFIWIPVALWTAFIPALAVTPTTAYAASKQLTLFTVSLALAVVPFQLLRTDWQRKRFLFTLAAISVITAVLAGVVGDATASAYTDRVVLAGSNTIGTARLVYTGTVIFLLLALAQRERARQAALAAAAIFTTTIGLFTGARGPTIALAIAVMAATLLSPIYRDRRKSALISIAIGGAVVLGVASVGDRSDGIQRVWTYLTGAVGEEAVADSRAVPWGAAWHQIGSNPWGSGWGTYSSMHGARHDYPHNLLLEVGAEAGVLVAIGVAVLLLATLVAGLKTTDTTDQAIIYALFVFGLVNALVSGDINGSRLMLATMFSVWAAYPPRTAHPSRTAGSDGLA